MTNWVEDVVQTLVNYQLTVNKLREELEKTRQANEYLTKELKACRSMGDKENHGLEAKVD